MSVARAAERRTKKAVSDVRVDSVSKLSRRFRIDPEFASLIPALAPDEFARLEASILAEGCLDPLVVWEEENILLDGHNRNRICTQHNVPFKIVSRSFPNREAARDFILQRQLGRRNISPEAASYLRGKRYLEMKCQGKRSDLTSDQTDRKSVSEQLGEKYKVGPATIRRDARFAEAVDRIAENCGDAARRWILSRELTLARSGVLRLSRLTPEEQRQYLQKLLDGESKPRFPSTRKTITLPAAPKDFVARLVQRLGIGGAGAIARLLVETLQTDGKQKPGGRSRRRSKV